MENHQKYTGFDVVARWPVYRYLEGLRNNVFFISDRLVRFLRKSPHMMGLTKE